MACHSKISTKFFPIYLKVQGNDTNIVTRRVQQGFARKTSASNSSGVKLALMAKGCLSVKYSQLRYHHMNWLTNVKSFLKIILWKFLKMVWSFMLIKLLNSLFQNSCFLNNLCWRKYCRLRKDFCY